MSLFNELKRRNVLRVAAAYIVLSWLLLQVVDVVAPMLNLPDWFGRGVLLLLALGFVPTLLFSWVYELTPEGIKRESEIDRSASITSETAKRLDVIVIILLVLATGLFVTERFVLRDSEPVAPVAEQAPEPTGKPSPERTSQASETDDRASVAVLPFANRSNREEDLFFTDGIHDDLLTQLSKIGSLKIISRTSVMPYRDSEKSLPTIAEELGVSNVVEGGIQRAGDQVRINVQLIDALTDEHLWAETFDRKLTAENLFTIQSEISERIAEALHARLSDDEVSRIERVPTDNLEAYQAYMLGRDHFRRRAETGPDALRVAITHFEKAIELEPEYAEAHAGLAATYTVMNGYLRDPDPANDNLAKRYAEEALSLNPDLAEAHAALGIHHRKARDMFAAEKSTLRAIELSPSFANAHLWLGIHYLIAGYLDRGHEQVMAALELDPTSGIVVFWTVYSFDLRNDLEGALRHNQTAIDLGFGWARLSGASFELRRGNATAAEQHIRSLFPNALADRWVETVIPAYQDPTLVDDAIRLIREGIPNAGQHLALNFIATLGAGEAAAEMIWERRNAETDLTSHGWRRGYPGIRQAPLFKEIVEYRRLPEYWRERGWPEFCRPVGDDDFECS